jgi:LPLT family lysophospholipid transporter-like MFS transporter
VTACHALAALANLLIPRLPPAHPLQKVSLPAILKDFGAAVRALFRHPDTSFSMAGTSLFWGTGSTLRFVLVAWVPVALGITTNRMPAYLNGVMAVGIVIGAALAARFITLQRADRVMPAGMLIGACVCVLATVTQLPMAFLVMTALGACGGYFIVPLNALLQETGRETVGAGHAIAVQNLMENFAMLVMVGLYVLATRAGLPVTWAAVVFGSSFTAAVGLLWLVRARKRGHEARA